MCCLTTISPVVTLTCWSAYLHDRLAISRRGSIRQVSPCELLTRRSVAGFENWLRVRLTGLTRTRASLRPVLRRAGRPPIPTAFAGRKRHQPRIIRDEISAVAPLDEQRSNRVRRSQRRIKGTRFLACETLPNYKLPSSATPWLGELPLRPTPIPTHMNRQQRKIAQPLPRPGDSQHLHYTPPLHIKQHTPHSRGGTRTPDPLINSQLL